MAGENRIKHLEFIQSVITRMNSNSFMIKGWCITLVSALFALAANDSNARFAMVSYIVIPSFWILDGFFIATERNFRKLYNDACVKKEEEIDFKMTPQKMTLGDWLCEGVCSRTLVPFYGIMIIATAITLFYF